jgi:hypothetical protein
MPVYLGMACTLGFGAVVFTQRAVFFAPIGEAGIDEEHTGAAMALGSFIGYAPAMFCFSLYGHILDAFPGLTGYKIVFGLMGHVCLCRDHSVGAVGQKYPRTRKTGPGSFCRLSRGL